MISTHVPSLELCKKLRDLGWKKETMFYHILLGGEASMVVYRNEGYVKEMLIPAPTVGEMMESIPTKVYFSKESNCYICNATPDEDVFQHKSLACLCAIVLIYFL